MKKKVKVLLAALAAVLCAAALIWSSLRPVLVEAVAVESATVALTFTETGSYEYSRQYEVYPLVAGEILELAVEEGDRVAAGDLLAVVSAADYEYQIRQLQSSIAGYQGQIANLQLQEEQERVSLAATLEGLEGQLLALEAEAALNRDVNGSLDKQISIQERLVEVNRGSVQAARDYLKEMRDYGEDAEIAQARLTYNNAMAAMAQNQILLEQMQNGETPQDIYEGQRQAIQAEMDALGTLLDGSYTGGMVQYYNAQIEAARAGIAQMEERAGQATLTAPVGGVLCQLPAADRNLVSQSVPAAVIGGDPLVEVFVPVREIDGVALGDAVELLLDKRLGTESVPGRVVEIAGEAQTRLSALGVEERKVRVLVQPEREVLQIGYDMDVRFTPHVFEAVLAVPKTAVFRDSEQDFVWVVADGVLALQPVEKGVETRDGYVIDAGLSAGDLVVEDADNSDLSEGRRVVAA